MKVVLFVLSMIDASWEYIELPDWKTVDDCEQYLASVQHVPEPDYIYGCGTMGRVSE